MDNHKLHGSFSGKLHGSWRADDHHDSCSSSKFHDSFNSPTKGAAHQQHQQHSSEEPQPTKPKKLPLWVTQDPTLYAGRPNDYVGGYDPTFIREYRRHQETKKQIAIEGYNAPASPVKYNKYNR